MDVKNITVLGSGVMGHGIAQVSATAGYNVVLRDIKQEFLDKAMEKIKWSLDNNKRRCHGDVFGLVGHFNVGKSGAIRSLNQRTSGISVAVFMFHSI